MITIDTKVGSKDLIKYFPKGVAELANLEFGDICFYGRGMKGKKVCIGFERKRLGGGSDDLLQSIKSGRLAGHQLPGMLMSYDMIYIIVEGYWRANPRSGELEEYRGKSWRPVAHGRRTYQASYIWNFINTQWVTSDKIKAWPTPDARGTALYIMSIYKWWNEKNFEDHRSHLVHYKPFVNMMPLSPVRRVIEALADGIGDRKSRVIDEYFPNVDCMMKASKEDWMSIPGVGPKLAERIIREIHSTEK